MSDFLSTMAASSLLRADGVRSRFGVARLTSKASSARPVIPLDPAESGFGVIAEAKLASPSQGRLAPEGDSTELVVEMAAELAGAGAVALSILTEPERFDGDLAHLEAVTRATDIPVMRKDFLVDPIQVLEARATGASGVLLISRILEPRLLVEMADLVRDLGMFCLVEVFDESDLDAADVVFDRDVLVGVNARNLHTLQIDPSSHERLAGRLPDHLPLVAESGINTAEDAGRVAGLGYGLALVGTALTTAVDPAGLVSAMSAAGKAA
ncbi:MAG: indole-3-glycerol-phosphate synthase [Actinomycetota bacterium]|nr:indole-3-glycerol-phosphate synthase [Actinomycetota bacterium]